MNKVSKKYGIGVPQCDEENESKLKNTLQDIIQENFPKCYKKNKIPRNTTNKEHKGPLQGELQTTAQ